MWGKDGLKGKRAMLKQRVLNLAEEQRGFNIEAGPSTSANAGTEVQESPSAQQEPAGRDNDNLSSETLRDSSPDALATDLGPGAAKITSEIHSPGEDDSKAQGSRRTRDSKPPAAAKPSADTPNASTPVAESEQAEASDDEIQFIETVAKPPRPRPVPRPTRRKGDGKLQVTTGVAPLRLRRD